MTASPVIESFRNKNQRTLSQLISRAENEDESIYPILSELYPNTGRAQSIGITGPPGAGKSTLVDHFIRFIRKESKSVAVIAIDPTSPFTGGALLGDRVRLTDHYNDSEVYIRSLSTRGKLGGLSLATREATHLCDAFGFDQILLETVGVGQSEIDVRELMDLTVLALNPESGDAIQTLKAGILEIADIFVIHKADREGANALEQEIKNMLQMANRTNPVVTTSTQDEKSLIHLFETVKAFATDQANLITQRRVRRSEQTIVNWMERRLLREANHWVQNHANPDKNPYAFVSRFMKQFPEGSLFPK